MDSAPAYILIVEDEPKLAALLGDYLKAAGHETAWIANGLDVIPAIRAREPDLVLLDLMLPGLSGEEVLPQLQGISVIVVSAKTAVQDKVGLLLGGAADYITKPFDTKELLARVAVRLRDATGKDHIEAVWGIGFRLRPES